MNKRRLKLNELQIVLIISVLLDTTVIFQHLIQASNVTLLIGVNNSHHTQLWLVCLILVAEVFIFVSTLLWPGVPRFLNVVMGGLNHCGMVNGLMVFLLPIGYIYLLFSGFAESIENFVPNIWLFGHLALLGSIFFKIWRPNTTYGLSLAFIVTTYAALHQATLFIPNISNYPLSLDWSEGSRYYNASLFFSKQLYGKTLPLPVLHPTRYMMQSAPFLFPDLPIWVHRLWQVILWLSLNAFAAITMVRRLKLKNNILAWTTTLGVFLFFFQGPIYYNLLVCVIVIFLTFNFKNPQITFVWVLLASIWAGISRINWYSMPGLFALTLYILEQPFSFDKTCWSYWKWPTSWVVGGSTIAYLTNMVYSLLSGNPLFQVNSSLRSPLLWYRLYPNATFSLGILQALLIATLPALVVLVFYISSHFRNIRLMRIVVIGITLCILFVGGLVVSVKIGGGSNLHNMDAFLILLAVVTVYALFDRFVPDFPSISVPSWRPGWLLLLFVLAIPTFSVITISNPLLKRDTTNAFQRLALVQYAIDRACTDGGQVLFITQRHLLTFKYLHAGQLVPDYEKVFLMEMAMSNNVDYLEQFHSDLENHRFSLIVSEPLANVLQKNYSFAEENNAWVIAVVQPLLKEYRQVAIFKDIGIELLEPK